MRSFYTLIFTVCVFLLGYFWLHDAVLPLAKTADVPIIHSNIVVDAYGRTELLYSYEYNDTLHVGNKMLSSSNTIVPLYVKILVGGGFELLLIVMYCVYAAALYAIMSVFYDDISDFCDESNINAICGILLWLLPSAFIIRILESLKQFPVLLF